MILFPIIGIFVAILIGIMTGITVSDIRIIRTERLYRLHPHARRWRVKPHVEIRTDNAKLASKLRRGYKKLVVGTQTEWVLSLTSDVVINPFQIHQAIRILSGHTSMRLLTILPSIVPPDSLIALLKTYATMIGAPLAVARNGFNAEPVEDYPMIHKSDLTITVRSMLYELLCFATTVFTIACFLLSFAMALLLATPEPLLALFTAFVLWSVWSIARYPGLSIAHRLLYAVFLPVACGYLFLRFSSLPARQLARLTRPRGAMINA